MTEFAYGDAAVTLTPEMRPSRIRKMVDDALRRMAGRGAVIVLNAERALPAKVIEAAAEVAAYRDDVCLYVLGDASGLDRTELAAFSGIHHLSLNTRSLVDYDFLASYVKLRSLTIQGHPTRSVDLSYLAGMSHLERLVIPAAVTSEVALASCASLKLLACTSNADIFRALIGHPALKYLNISFGTNRDLTALPQMPHLRGVSMYQIRSLTSDDLAPFADCAGLVALSLGGLRNLTHLTALAGRPSKSLRALLMEQVPNISSLQDVAACVALEQLGLYDSRPTDKSLAPLRALPSLKHLALGDVYPEAEIDALLRWYSGALQYRSKIERGEFKPRWRTAIDRLIPEGGA